jgi:ribosomal protein S18 acetylase RimI-like enzyme
VIPIVRLATIEDADVLSRLNYEFNGGDKRPEAEIIGSLNTGNELVAVAELRDEVVGFACAQSSQSFCYAASHGEITEMYVQESARRKGVAAALLAFLEAQLRLRGVGTVKILTGRTNDPAIATYASCGYVKHDEAVLEKRL